MVEKQVNLTGNKSTSYAGLAYLIVPACKCHNYVTSCVTVYSLRCLFLVPDCFNLRNCPVLTYRTK